jgi:hypothetical protein
MMNLALSIRCWACQEVSFKTILHRGYREITKTKNLKIGIKDFTRIEIF